MTNERSGIEDELLVMDAQDGNADAMEKLVSRWQKRLWHHAYRLAGDTDAAWDITQQSWLGIIKGLRKLHDPANFKAWAYRITTNKSVNWIKKRQAITHISIEELQLNKREEKKDIGVKELLQKLEPKKRAVLSLYYFEQLNVAEISEVLNIPAGTVKSRLHNARKEFKELWQNNFD